MAPWDLAGTASNGNSRPYDTTRLPDGEHLISAEVTLDDSSLVNLTATILVDNSTAVLEPTPASFSETLHSRSIITRPLTVETSAGSEVDVSLGVDQSWVSFSAASGTTPFSTNVALDSSALSSGTHNATITVSSSSLNPITIPVTLELNLSSGTYDLMVSLSSDRSAADVLQGQSVLGDIFVFTAPDSGVSSVDFYLNDPGHAGSPYKKEGAAPYDLAGTAYNGSAQPLDTTLLAAGNYTVTAELKLSNGSLDYASGDFTLSGGGFNFSPDSLSFTVTDPETTAEATVDISYAEGAEEIYTITSTAGWLLVQPDMEMTAATHTVSVDVTGLDPGTYQAELVVEGPVTDTIPVSLTYETLDSNSFTVMVSAASDRSHSVGLDGQELVGNAYVHLQPEDGVSKVEFYINTLVDGTPDKIERLAPYDLAGTASNGSALPFDTTTLADGNNFVTVAVYKSNGGNETLGANFTVANNPDPAFILSPEEVFESANSGDSPRGVIVSLGLNASAEGITPNFSVSENVSWLGVSPASGTAPEELTLTLDPSGLSGGTYETTVTIVSDALPTVSLPVALTVLDGLPSLVANPGQITLTVPPDSGTHTSSFDISTSNGSSTAYSDQSNQFWLTVEGNDGFAPETVTLKVDSNGLDLGVYKAELELTATDYGPTTVFVTLEVADQTDCGPVPCSEVRVNLPYILEFEEGAGGVLDLFGQGMGFTYVLPSSKVDSYLQDNVELNLGAGVLDITSTKGILHLDVNNQINPLGVGFAGPNQITKITTTLNNPHPGTGNYEQAGLWFGYNEDNYVKLVYNSFLADPVVEFAYEQNGVWTKSTARKVGDLSGSRLELELIANPSTRAVDAYYLINGGFRTHVDNIIVEPEFFSFDAAGIDPEIGTRSFTGIMTTNRHGPAPITYEFERFAVEATVSEAVETAFSFSRSSHPLDFPTAMVWAPDGKLYVTELFGTIHALTFDENLNAISDEVITSLTDTLGQRLTLGITYYDDDPSDDSVFSLWVASSSPSINDGVANSSTVTRLSGPNFGTVEQVITGLPRAKANHAINHIHFGADDRLYIASGGNTGAGAVVDEPNEFKDRAEQPLSAALLVADVFAGGFDGSCANNEDIYGPAPCDVVTYATGLRNTYDFVFHSNGEIYAPDNGLGVTGGFPPRPEPDCSGIASAVPVEQGGHNPGSQPDFLVRLQQGRYYGHPNPSRDECVFQDGRLQGVAPLPNYEPPMSDLGMNASANGIIEYRSSRACGRLQTDLLIVRYSLGDDIVRVQLTGDGLAVESQEVLATGFNDPLVIAERNGDLFVGEFGGGKVTALRLDPVACWSTAQPMPVEILDPGSVGADGYLYSIAGKLSSGPVNHVYRYDPNFDAWAQLASKPGTAVENPAVAADGGYLYVMGGSSGPFSGAVDELWRYDIAANSWNSLAPMPQPMGGIRAEVIDGRIYVAGGMSGNGASVASLMIYDIASNSWSFGPSMAQERDNPGTVVIDGELYVLGGRHRLSDGSTLAEGVDSMEIYNPQVGSWRDGGVIRGRRTFAIGAIDGKLQVVGGEKNPDSPGQMFYEVDVYDPATGNWSQLDDAPEPRHGGAYATIGNRLIVAGGGSAAGSSFTDTTQIMVLD
ncbi:Kelch repeat-containing protein [Marinimicrobium sp. C2-29]|uniref:Kelch repeat-containing protein n=1 Tax=Marinimicrobium sp. C2-29 TaxID=3139825 RepID=UPI003139C821